MKNIFTVSEEEKNRILGLHETHKNNKENLITEQEDAGNTDNINISGQVVEMLGEGEGTEELIGVNVIVKDSNPIIGVATDMEGKFILKNIPRDSIITFSYIGYEAKASARSGPIHYRGQYFSLTVPQGGPL